MSIWRQNLLQTPLMFVLLLPHARDNINKSFKLMLNHVYKQVIDRYKEPCPIVRYPNSTSVKWDINLQDKETFMSVFLITNHDAICSPWKDRVQSLKPSSVCLLWKLKARLAKRGLQNGHTLG